jgi:large subunit ribosomal protein L21
MYAVIRTGGKQYTVKPGDVLQVPKLDKELGAEFDINEVLMVGGDATHLGQPLLQGAKVTVVVTKQARTRKLIVFKKKRRHSYRNFQTHKQDFTEIFVKSVTSPDGKSAKTDATPKVVDVAAARMEKITARTTAKKEALKNPAAKEEKKQAKKSPVKKAAAKKAAPKKKAGAAKKKAGAKKSTKKTAKKA